MKNRTLFFGEGLFETFRVYGGRKLSFVEDHLERMAEGCRFFDLPFVWEKAVEALRDAAEAIAPDAEGRLRLNLVSHGKSDVEKVLFETWWEPLPRPVEGEGRDVSLVLSPFGRFSGSPLVRFKTTSYLENIFAFRWARKQGYFDALFTNERDEITEGSIANIFFINKGHISTPPLEAGLLPGITRKQVIAVARGLGIPLSEKTMAPGNLSHSDGAFVTNSVIEILSVNRVGNTRYETPEMVSTLQKAYRNHMNNHLFPL
jgi:branched-subunit amino acid aminotransferase/4-amino-4-deoxychorismate lyase